MIPACPGNGGLFAPADCRQMMERAHGTSIEGHRVELERRCVGDRRGTRTLVNDRSPTAEHRKTTIARRPSPDQRAIEVCRVMISGGGVGGS